MESERVERWEDFYFQVSKHIKSYCNPQYGNPSGNEQVDNFTTEDCWQNIQRYYNRRNSCVRGNKEKLRDAIKVAHYAQFIYDKLKAELSEEDIY